MARLFNAYVMVQWSAASKPTTGTDSVWIGALKRDLRFRLAFEAHNPPTRARAEALLTTILEDRVKRRERTLVGFTFPLGFPHGLAASLKLAGDHPWRALWDQLARMVKDKADNTNNRFGVGSEINRRVTGGPFPFWGCPPRDTLTTLQPKRGRDHGDGDLPEYRQVELAQKSVNPVWKLYYNGAVGGQAILGVPMVRRLHDKPGAVTRVWPFETGWKALTETDLAGVDMVVAEISANFAKGRPLPGEHQDAADVRALAEQFARLDENGKLGELFAAPKRASPDFVRGVESEEGWALGA